MKTSNVLASLLFGSLAVAAPVNNKRDLVTKTEVLVETVVVFTTVWDDEVPNASEPTSTPGLFYEQPSKPASPSAEATSTPAYTPPVVEPSSVYTPPPASTPAPTSATPVYTPPVSSAQAPEPSSVYTPAPSPSPVAAPVSSAAAPAASSPASSNSDTQTTGEMHTGDLTIYDNTGAAGSCGEPLYDTDDIVALNHVDMGPATYDTMTGKATNPWCGKKIILEYKGKSVPATIMDTCPGCDKGAIDASLKVWKDLTGLDEKTRLTVNWYVAA